MPGQEWFLTVKKKKKKYKEYPFREFKERISTRARSGVLDSSGLCESKTPDLALLGNALLKVPKGIPFGKETGAFLFSNLMYFFFF